MSRASAPGASGSGREAGKPVSLALQGGGAHGAFAWGVLDRLLEDARLTIEAVSATSAGAMNAVVMAHGCSVGGTEGARAALEAFWREVSQAAGVMSQMLASPWDRLLKAAGLNGDLTPGYLMFQAMTHIWSPYQFNPFDFDPLRRILVHQVDFERLRACRVSPRLYLSATNVRSGKVKVFENAELSADVVLASACLPFLFKAVEIAGEHYWDGGFMGNPAIFPLIYRNGTSDVVIVHINPIERPRLPTTAPEIFDRMNELSFNSSLMREMRAIAFVTRLIDEGALDGSRYRRMLIHSIRDDAAMAELGVASKLDASWGFLCGLRDLGRATAGAWLEGAYEAVGQRSTVDLVRTFL